MAKRAGRVGFGSGQTGRGSKRVTGQNGSFLNGLSGLRVKRVAGQTGRVKRVWPVLPCRTHGYFHHLPIKFLSLSFLLILKRKNFVGSREKTPGPYQFFFLSSPNQTLAKKVFIFIFFPKFFFPFSFQSFQLVKFLIVE